MLDEVCFVTYDMAKALVQNYHYSQVLPRLTKECVGGFIGNKLVAVATLGYGVRPLHTIRKIFPTLGVKDYLELGKLCLSDYCKRNTESYFISQMIKKLKEKRPELKLLFSWADGILGKPGYVYQASNFLYGGFIWTEMYLDKDNVRVHPRTLQGISDRKGKGRLGSRSYETTTEMGLKKYFGLQFRYVYPLCHKKEWKRLLETSPCEWTTKYPKDSDCKWKVQTAKGERMECDKPESVATEYTKGIVREQKQAGFFARKRDREANKYVWVNR